MKNKSVFFGLFITIGIVFVIVFLARNSSQEIQDKITIITAVLGFMAIIYQLRSDHKIKRAEFIYSLNDSFNNDSDICQSYKLLKKYRDEKNTEITLKDCRDMGSYIMFFIIMNYLIESKLVTIRMIDKIFANKFFLLCNNPYVQEYQLESVEINYPIMELYEKWYNYRLVYCDGLLYEKHSYSNNQKIFRRETNGTIVFIHKKRRSMKYYLNILLHKPNIVLEPKSLYTNQED